MPICGARTRSGGTCQKHALEGATRCRLHGGAASKVNKGNAHAVKHGFYSDALLPEERVLYERAEVGSLDDEIRLARVKLHRFVRLANSVDLMEMVDGALQVIYKTGEAWDQVEKQMLPFDKKEIKAAAPDYADLIIRQIDLIRKLELARADLSRETPPPPAQAVGRIEVEIVGAKHKDADD